MGIAPESAALSCGVREDRSIAGSGGALFSLRSQGKPLLLCRAPVQQNTLDFQAGIRRAPFCGNAPDVLIRPRFPGGCFRVFSVFFGEYCGYPDGKSGFCRKIPFAATDSAPKSGKYVIWYASDRSRRGQHMLRASQIAQHRPAREKGCRVHEGRAAPVR